MSRNKAFRLFFIFRRLFGLVGPAAFSLPRVRRNESATIFATAADRSGGRPGTFLGAAFAKPRRGFGGSPVTEVCVIDVH
jgi:hypothetical protein